MSITELMIRNSTTPQSFERGEDYYRTGAVLEITKRGNTLLAQVEGSQYEPYRVKIELAEWGVVEADCTCPYDWGGYCKHIVAVLLAYVRQPEQVTERSPVAELLSDLDRDELLDLLTNLLVDKPDLMDWVERRLTIQAIPTETESPDQPRRRQTPLDPESFRNLAQNIVSSYDYGRWGNGDNPVDEIGALVEKARPFIEAGDGQNALLILGPVADVFAEHWYEVDYYGDESATLFSNLGSLLAEAILSADLSQEARNALADKMTIWQDKIENYGIEEGFDVAIAAAEQGWDYPPLQSVLQGHITPQGAWEGEAPWFADELAVARLNVLERQNRATEYLYLAEAEGQTARYLTMLVKLERTEEAIEYALQHLTTADDALALAEALREHNQPQEALKIAEHGLELSGNTLTLARWLRDFATGIHQSEVALKAAKGAFVNSFSLEDYQAAEIVAGAKWPSVKAELLNQLAAADYASGRIDIYLHENMIDEAIKTLDRERYVSYYTLAPVVEAAWQTHPDWVIRQCKRQAEPIMNEGRSKHYHHAIRWLERARKAYLGADRAEAWSKYLESLIDKHNRKYSLRPQLEELRV